MILLRMVLLIMQVFPMPLVSQPHHYHIATLTHRLESNLASICNKCYYHIVVLTFRFTMISLIQFIIILLCTRQTFQLQSYIIEMSWHPHCLHCTIWTNWNPCCIQSHCQMDQLLQFRFSMWKQFYCQFCMIQTKCNMTILPVDMIYFLESPPFQWRTMMKFILVIFGLLLGIITVEMILMHFHWGWFVFMTRHTLMYLDHCHVHHLLQHFLSLMRNVVATASSMQC